jgi:hypothetical protein
MYLLVVLHGHAVGVLHSVPVFEDIVEMLQNR